MRSTKYIIIAFCVFTVMSCKNSGQPKEDIRKNNSPDIVLCKDSGQINFAPIENAYNTLLDSILFNSNSVIDVFFTQNTIRENGIYLSDSLKKALFTNTKIEKQMLENDCYLYNIIKSSNNIYSFVISLTGLTKDGVYIINMNNDQQLTDYLSFEYCDYFDAYTPKYQSYEKAIYLIKYFKYINDTTFISTQIEKGEKKYFGKSEVFEQTIDSLSYTYLIDRYGKFNLYGKDSVRVLSFKN